MEDVHQVTDVDSDELWPKLTELYGPEAIIVYKPEGLDYFVTESQNLPVRTKEIIKGLATRMI